MDARFPFFAVPSAPRRIALPAFLAMLAVLMLALLPLRTNQPISGDGLEYALMTMALSKRGSATITPADIATARQVMPHQFAGALDPLDAAIREHKPLPAGFYAGRTGAQAIHFFGYSALAVPPYKMLQAAGLSPLRCFLVLNLAFLLLLGWSAYESLGGAVTALSGTVLFLLCGGILYWDWSGPDFITAAALLAALLWFASGRLLAAGLMLGIAAMQNPGLALLIPGIPVLLWCLRDGGVNWRKTGPPLLGALVLAAALAVLAPLYNLYQFGVPSIIAKLSTASDLASTARLFSLYFDINQGMIVALPVLGPVLIGAAFTGSAEPRSRYRVLLLVCIVGSIVPVLPALVVHNWNAGGNGVMRYAFWAAMPLLFAFLWRLGRYGVPRWPLLATVGALQAGAMAAATRTSYTDFTPQARAVLAAAPQLYNPEPEIFHERVTHQESYPGPEKVFRYAPNGTTIKTMYHDHHPDIDAELCPSGQRLADGMSRTSADHGWRYLNGPIRCQPDAGTLRLGLPQFQAGQGIHLTQGWGTPEAGGGTWDGVWSTGKTSTLAIDAPAARKDAQLTILGHYTEGNRRTRVTVNGRDLGWMALDTPQRISLTGAADGRIAVTLQHEAPAQPNPDDRRTLAFFLQRIEVR
ncbi:hypothetical protein ACFFTM_01425 [Pseudoduganella plicata]|uniref:Glycosyltransferase RgtA/B/C/D-like domain-containing protein n=1 Tax=Pseudoduganella plicata TaxID=321984 RepID=A0A4P7BEJ7_9BURK|nr:hypothetical protein [Pseudoduganella plicata]QBQ36680.1 hypothetical protein E1742_11275 [Pseudoduganella plicata]GGY73564.1 hypothetical protein GCM10007388_02160 [Pseudoduganella plicata]